jgi:carbon storage regulator
MLVLRRRAGESVLIGYDIEVEVLAVTQQGAKIGIRAPRDTIVLRKELKITQKQNTEAAKSGSLKDLEETIQKFRPENSRSGPAPR